MKSHDFIPTRHSLLRRIKDWNDQDGWSDFIDTYSRLIYSMASKAGLPHPDAQEVVQDTVLTVARKIKEFQPDPQRGSFKAWLMTITRCRIVDQFRKTASARTVPHQRSNQKAGTATEERVPDPEGPELEAAWDQEWERHLMETALDKIRKRVPPHQFQMFHLHVIKQWPARKVAAKLHVSLHQVYFARQKGLAMMQNEIQLLRNKMP